MILAANHPCWITTHSPSPPSIQLPNARDTWRALLWGGGGTSWQRRAIHAFGIHLEAQNCVTLGLFLIIYTEIAKQNEQWALSCSVEFQQEMGL